MNGIDDGKHKYSSDVLFLIWNALKEHNITIPYPQRVVELRAEKGVVSFAQTGAGDRKRALGAHGG